MQALEAASERGRREASAGEPRRRAVQRMPPRHGAGEEGHRWETAGCAEAWCV